ncbi:MAG: AsmA-like C-terminal region-containing protein [Desulfobacterales bacterium]|nr:AsmA-like C-terminal region-containing protein [Desulfobacterales bacterium]
MMRKKTWALIAVVIILLIVVSGVGLYFGLTAPGFLTPRIEKAMGERLNADVRMRGVDFSLLSGVHIEELALSPAEIRGKPGAEAPLALTDIRIRHSWLSLLRGKYRPTRVIVEKLNARMAPEYVDWLSGIEPPDPSRPKPEIDIKNGRLKLQWPVFTRPVQINNLNFSVWPEAGGKKVTGTSRFEFGKNRVRMGFEVMPESGEINTRFTLHGFDLSALPAVESEKAVFEPEKLEMAGILSGTLAIHLASEGRRPDLNGEITVSGLSARYPGVPFEFENGFAKLSVTDNTVAIRDGAINCAQGGVEIPAAGLRFENQSLTCAWLRASVSGIDVPVIADERLLAFLPEHYRPQLDGGKATGGVYLRWQPGDDLSYSGDFMLTGVSGSMPAYETDFSELDANVSLSAPGRIVIRQARARVLGGRAEAAGSCQFIGGKIKNPALELRLADVTETSHVVSRLPAGVRNVIDKAGFKGSEIDGLIALQPGHTKVDLSIAARQAELPDLPIQLTDPHLDVRWTSEARRVVFDNVRAKFNGSPLAGSGTLVFGRKSPYLNFSILGRYLPVNNQVLEWAGLELKNWRAGGRFDIEMRAKQWWPSGTGAAEFLDNMRVQVDMRDGVLHHPEAGKLAENISGHLMLDREGVHFSSLIGDVYGIGLRGSGRVPFSEDSENAYFRMESENISLDEKLYDRLPFDIGLKELGLAGQCEVKGELQGIGLKDKPFSGNMTMLMHHVEMQPKATRINASGTARVTVSAPNWQEFEISGVMELDGLSYGNLDAERVSADFAYKDRMLDIPELVVGAYGGKLNFKETRIDTTAGSWQTQAHMAHLDLESLVGAFGVEGRKAPSGVMRGDIEMSGRGLNPGTFSGEGTIKIGRGRLYSFPVLVSVFNVLDLKLPRQSPVTDAYGDFRIDEGRLAIRDLLFSGGSVPAHMEGEISLDSAGSLKQMPIDLIVTVAKQEGILDQIPLLNWAKHYTVDYLRRLVLQARVKGTFGDYKVDTLSSPLTSPIRKMFSLLERFTPAPPGGN